MQPEYLVEVKKLGQSVNPLFKFLGIKVESISAAEVVISLPLKPEFIQGGGFAAGGVLAALADEAMAHVVLANLRPDETTATIEMSIRFLSTIREGVIRAFARVIKKGRKIVTVEVEIRDDNDRVLARAAASFIVLEGK